MKKILAFIPLALATAASHAATYQISPGASAGTIQSSINAAAAAAGPSTVSFAAGAYNITVPINIPCPASALTVTGPIVPFQNPSAYTASLNGAVPGNWGFAVNPCSTPITIEYLNWNGGEPSAGGGGFLYVSSGVNNLTVTNNFIHGNQASVSDSHEYDSLIWFDGDDSDPSSNYDNNDTVSWNIMGASNDGTPSNADCGALANLYTYQGGTFDAIGGYCAAIGVHSSTNGLTINNNIIQFQEQGMKFFEGGSTASTFFNQSNQNIIANDISYIHRITIESQQSPNGTNINNNSIHDQTNPAWGSWGFSVPEGPSVNCNNNVLIANLTNSGGGAGPGSVEFWGGGTCNNNLVQGYWGAGMQYGYGATGWSMSNNIIQLPGNNSYINNEESIACCYPTMTGNVETESLSAQTSSSPTILPAPSGNYSAAITVTLADAGNTSGVGPQGNTRVFYTTDGSTPSTSSKLYTAPFAVQPGTTVKAIGMWGAANQPTSYAAGYGFVPSSVVAAVYPGSNGAKTTVALVSISVSGTSNTIAIGGTLQVSATGTYSDGSSAPIVSSTVTWSTNNTAILSVSSSGLVTGVSSGSGNVTAKVGSISSSPYAVTVAPATSTSGPTLVSAYLNSTADTLVVGGTLQFTMIGVYSDGSSSAVPNSSIQWQTSNSSVLTVSSSGLATAVSAGPAMVAASMGSTSSSPWIVTVSATAPEVPTPAAPAAPVQDAFQGPFWKSGTPAGGSTSISNAHLFLNVPGGANHDAIVPSNQAVRMMQTIGNYNFDVSMKIDSDIEASNANTSQGMMVYSDAQDYLTYAVTTDGTNIHLVVYVVSAGVANKVFDDTNFSQYQNPIYLRLTRTGSAYVAFYSIDGSDWNQAASFTSAKAPASIGPFAGNYNSTPANAVPVVMSVNWFNVE